MPGYRLDRTPAEVAVTPLPAFTVAIPVRNEENTLRACVAAALHQTAPPAHVLVCVNGSTDRTAVVARDLAARDRRVRVIGCPPGKPAAWNALVGASETDLIHHMDGDVRPRPDASRRLLETWVAGDERLALVGGAICFRAPDRPGLFHRVFGASGDRLYTPGFVCGPNYLMSRSRVLSIAARLGIPVLPTDVVNDDGYLNAVYLRQPGAVRVDHRSIVDSQELDSFADWLAARRRVLNGQRQVAAMLGDYLDRPADALPGPPGLRARFSAASVREKATLPLLLAMQQATRLEVALTHPAQRVVWRETRSTKRPLREA
jgi:glycosyltransferase involved in cell wall biosynthesis